MNKQSRVIGAVVMAAGLIGLPACSSAPKAEGARVSETRAATTDVRRGVFVTRWDYRTVADIEQIVEQARAAGFTDLYWQVRGQADAFYQSSIEPWGEELAGDGHGPGFDPLAAAIGAAHGSGMRVHAWFNTLTLWYGQAAPKNPRHVRVAHPAWRLTGADGRAVKTRDGYELVNPVLPEVRDHLAGVVADLVERYELDGVCFDTLRLPSGAVPGDALSRRLFASENADQLGAGAARDEVERAWIAERVTETARRLAEAARQGREGVEVSFVVVGQTPGVSEQQCAAGSAWVAGGIADRLIALIPSDTADGYTKAMTAWRDGLAKRGGSKQEPLIPAVIPANVLDVAVLGEQLNAIGKRSPLAVFSYAQVFESADMAVARDTRSSAVRSARRELVTSLIGPKVGKAKEERPLRLDEVKGTPTPKKAAGKDDKKDAAKGEAKAEKAEPDGEKPKDGEEVEPSSKPEPKETPEPDSNQDSNPDPKPDDSPKPDEGPDPRSGKEPSDDRGGEA